MQTIQKYINKVWMQRGKPIILHHKSTKQDAMLQPLKRSKKIVISAYLLKVMKIGQTTKTMQIVVVDAKSTQV